MASKRKKILLSLRVKLKEKTKQPKTRVLVTMSRFPGE